MPRIIAACIGIFGLANAIAGCFRAELDANSWWIDFRGMPDGAARALIAVACCVLLAYALFPEMSAVRKALSLAILSVLLIASIANCVTYFALLFRGWIRTTMPIPLSAFVAAVFAWIAFEIYSERVAAREMKWHTIIPTLILCGVGFPLSQIFLFGKTDYSRPAEAAIVFGARVYSDGSASTALADRVRTACELYRRGLAKTLIFSGGPGDGSFHETDVMRALAIQWGVSDNDIVLDRDGLNTRATIENTRVHFSEARGTRPRLLAVSHFYHLPRIKLESQRLGLDIVTVPARESYTLTKMPFLIGREVAALWTYYLQPPARM